MGNEIINSSNMDIQTVAGDISKQLADQINAIIEEKLIEALKVKGYVFETREQLEQFIATKCTCKVDEERNERTYYVNEKPFFLHRYGLKTEISQNNDTGNWTIKATNGVYAFL